MRERMVGTCRVESMVSLAEFRGDGRQELRWKQWVDLERYIHVRLTPRVKSIYVQENQVYVVSRAQAPYL